MSATSALVTVIVPTHDHCSTLDLAVGSILAQSLSALRIVIIGDGVGDDTREAVASLVRDPRVRFVDTPKSSSRAETVRHQVLSEADTPFVCYLGDDDLMLEDHVETLVDLLSEADFAHPLPLMVDADGSLRAHPTDIGRSECRAWHLDPGRNSISLSGVAHRLDAYRQLPDGWREPPPGRWSDHYMWEQWLGVGGLRFITGSRLTVLKFDASVRRSQSAGERRAELLSWRDRAAKPDFEGALGLMAAEAFRRSAVDIRLELATAEDRASQDAQTADIAQALAAEQLGDLERRIHGLEAAISAATVRLGERAEELAALHRERDALESARATAISRVSDLEATRTWRLHLWLERRGLLSWTARRRVVERRQ